MIPWLSPTLWLGAALAVAAAFAGVQTVRIANLKADHAEQARKREADIREARDRDVRRANRASSELERAREAIRVALNDQAEQEVLDAALNATVHECPRTVGDAVIPGALGVRLNAIDRAASAGPGAGKPAR